MRRNYFFSKYHGIGNDFILIDDREELFPINQPSIIKKICHRNLGVGADGIVLLQNSANADFSMKIFNRDGHEAQSCGNGCRCLLQYITQELGFDKDKNYRIAMKEETICGKWCSPTDVQLFFPPPKVYLLQQKMQVFDREITVHYFYCGVPHIVFFVPSLDFVDRNIWGKALREDRRFCSDGANVDFAVVSAEHIKISTFERGVETITLACGTGAVATALAAHYVLRRPSPVCLQFSHGQLFVDISYESGKISTIALRGEACKVFSGKVEI